MTDERALARYRYLVKTAPPEAIEQAHAEAFAQLTPAQRQQLLQEIGNALPPSDRALAGPANATPHGMARLVTRAEMRQPGTIERLFGVGRSGGMGRIVAGSLLGSLAGVVIGSVVGSALAQQFFADPAADLAAGAGAGDDALLATSDAGLQDTTFDGNEPLPDDRLVTADPAGDGGDAGGDLASDFGIDTFDI